NTTDYCSNVIYENGVLSMILTEEGYVTLSGDAPIYHYYLKDHQGNNRIVMNQNGTTVEQVNHYYPFGGLFEEGLATSNQNYKYNSKELDRMHGLDWYDYGARHYDMALGRFTTMDPLVEKCYWISSYTYCLNNPANLIDPDGRDWYRVKDENNEWTYLWSTEIHSQKELDKTIKGAEYLGLTYKSDNTYYSLFGQTEDANTKEGKAMSKLDAAIINYVDFLKESVIDSEIKQRQTDFDIGAYARTSALGLTEDTYFSFEYGAQGNTGIAYYYMIGRGQQNKGTFESWTTTNRFTYNSNRGTGSMKSGYNLRFPRSGGSSNNWSARVVFTTKEAKNNTYSIFKKLFFYESK
ncbi:MAG: RHS repeat-associated core domain-containing protein, partial [Staphylococcus sp.]|nr:RHS repeat-associated core domain-containing protein [Staphylococcus sp.]